MNNQNSDTVASTFRSSAPRPSSEQDELSRIKRELLQAEVRLAKARATATTAEIDVKVLTARLRALAK